MLDGVRPVARSEVPQAPLEWIDVAGSMTARIHAMSGEEPTVQLLYTGARSASAWEAQHLGATLGFSREIELRAGEMLCLTARSIVAERSSAATMLACLGLKPLAEVLFQGSWLQQEIVPVHTGDGRFGRACIWLNEDRESLLLTEVFDPAFVARFSRSPQRSS